MTSSADAPTGRRRLRHQPGGQPSAHRFTAHFYFSILYLIGGGWLSLASEHEAEALTGLDTGTPTTNSGVPPTDKRRPTVKGGPVLYSSHPSPTVSPLTTDGLAVEATSSMTKATMKTVAVSAAAATGLPRPPRRYNWPPANGAPLPFPPPPPPARPRRQSAPLGCGAWGGRVPFGGPSGGGRLEAGGGSCITADAPVGSRTQLLKDSIGRCLSCRGWRRRTVSNMGLGGLVGE